VVDYCTLPEHQTPDNFLFSIIKKTLPLQAEFDSLFIPHFFHANPVWNSILFRSALTELHVVLQTVHPEGISCNLPGAPSAAPGEAAFPSPPGNLTPGCLLRGE
jgi:hypothetical protein